MHSVRSIHITLFYHHITLLEAAGAIHKLPVGNNPYGTHFIGASTRCGSRSVHCTTCSCLWVNTVALIDLIIALRIVAVIVAVTRTICMLLHLVAVVAPAQVAACNCK